MSVESSTDDPLAAFVAELRRAMPGIPEGDVPRFVSALTHRGPYQPCPEATSSGSVAAGSVSPQRHVSTGIYPGVERDVRVYVPPASARRGPLALMVFQDGAMYLGAEVSAAVVFDHLIAVGEMPPCIGLFVEPGEAGPGLPVYGGTGNRSVEYDSLGPRYATLLVDELIPAMTQGFELSASRSDRAICGLSSGGICAFNTAWERPDYFGKVVSHCGSFVDIRGGHVLPAMVRGSERKPLRVFLQSGEHDLDVLFGCWPLANRELASALDYRGYDYHFAFGSGGHSLAHGGALFADTLRWLWRDWREERAAIGSG